jgi:hypothetical protein
MSPKNRDLDNRRDPKDHWPIDRDALRRAGETRRDVGMAAAALPKSLRVRAGMVAMLDALIRSPDGTATIDDATAPDDLAAAYADGGQWRGSVTRSLAAMGLIAKVAAGASDRPSRHAGARYVWRLVSRPKAIIARCRLAAAVQLALTTGDDPELLKDKTTPLAPRRKEQARGVVDGSNPNKTESNHGQAD